MEAYEFIDVETALVGVVKTQVRVPASTMVPNPKPVEHVQVTRVGGTADRVADRPMVTFIVSAATWPAASALASLARRRLMSVSRLDGLPVYRVVEVGGPSRSPDPETGSARYQFTLEFKLRGVNASD